MTMSLKGHAIPYTKWEVIELICQDGKLEADWVEKFRNFAQVVESVFHYDYHDELEALKESFHPFNPDRDSALPQNYSEDYKKKCEDILLANFKKILEAANYHQVTEQDLAYAMKEESLFKVSLFVDFDDFEQSLIFCRGDKTEKVVIKKWVFWKEEMEVQIYERVAMFIKFKGETYFKNKKRGDLLFEPGGMVIKLFKNIPKADLEMLFPNTQVGMRLKDKAVLSITGIGGGVGVIMAKGAALVTMFVILLRVVANWFSGGEMGSLSGSEIAALGTGAIALGAVGGFLWKQWSNYRNRRIFFMKTLADNLYFKNLDNNMGVFHHIIDAAEEEECKEALLGYYFLLLHPDGLGQQELDQMVENWFFEKHGTKLDFEVADAVAKLIRFGLSREVGQSENGDTIYQVLPLDDACEQLDKVWDNYFTYNNRPAE